MDFSTVPDGTYRGSYGMEVAEAEVTVTVENGKVTSIEVLSFDEGREVLLSRDRERAERARRDLVSMTGNERIETMQADLAQWDSVRRAATPERLEMIFALVRNLPWYPRSQPRLRDRLHWSVRSPRIAVFIVFQADIVKNGLCRYLSPMSLSDYIASEDLVLMLRSKTKKGALAELTRAVAGRLPEVPYENILAAVWEREKLLTTKTAPGIAIPHALIPGMDATTIAIGKSAAGIEYDTKANGKVYLVILIVGGESTYLKALSEVASHLQNPDVVARMMSASGKKELCELLTTPLSEIVSAEKPPVLSRAVYEQALKLAERVRASVVIIHDPPGSLKGIPFPEREHIRLIYAYTESRTESSDTSDTPHQLFVPFRGLNRSSHIEITLLLALSKGLVHKGDKVISVFGLASSSTLDTIVVTDVDKEFRMFFSMPLEKQPEDMDQQVFIRVLQLATELANEGREGRPVGTLFIVGDYLNVSKHCQQLVINPFNGYQEHEKNILDPGLAETIKEFSRIDGAFIIRGDGVIVSAGTYLRVENPIRNLPPGLGARHAAAAGITATTGAVAIAVSESTRQISLFSAGERIMVV